MTRLLPAIGLLALPALPASAEDFERVTEREQFLEVVEGRELRIGILGISLRVGSDGRIEGSAQGWPVTGTWSWEGGFFCREMEWGGYEIAYNCQLVEVRGDDRIRFTSDRGQGQSASFTIR